VSIAKLGVGVTGSSACRISWVSSRGRLLPNCMNGIILGISFMLYIEKGVGYLHEMYKYNVSA